MLMERTVTLPGPQALRHPTVDLSHTPLPVAVVFADGTSQPLPDNVAKAFHEIIATLSSGQAVTIGHVNTTLTTQEAADILGVSRPTVVRFLDEGRLPYTRPGSHRRLALEDVMTFRETWHRERREALSELTYTTGLRSDNLVSTR
jgi:excisionase family DNA binding protein